ncbi:MAG: rRNA methyltransferase [Phycisphaerae bacterium]|nr:rRNA methyltransferase [Phycisphaerae bacterium]
MNGPHQIDSLDDPRIEPFRDVRDRDLRGRDGLFMAESELVLQRLLRQPERLHALLLSPEKFSRLEGALANLPDAVPIYIADLELMGRIAGFHVHRGVLATGHRPSSEELDASTLLAGFKNSNRCTLLMATGITNVDNMGSLFRNAAAFGVDAVILNANCCDPLYRKAIRVSMGHVLGMPWAIAEDWVATLGLLRTSLGMQVWAAECDSRSVPATSTGQPDRLAIVMGPEGSGLDERTLEACSSIVEIPMSIGVPSLNVATAAAILLWERSRVISEQRDQRSIGC